MEQSSLNHLWLERQLDLTRRSGLVVFHGGLELGVSHILGAVERGPQPMVWLELKARDSGDAVVQGNKLSEALTRALGSALVGYGLPFTHTLAVLRTHLSLIGPLTFAVTGAEHGLELSRALIGLQGAGNRVLLHFTAVPADFDYPPQTLVLGYDDLRLTWPEAQSLAQSEDAVASAQQVEALWQQSEGVFEHFRVMLAQSRGFSLVVRPSPNGPQVVAWQSVEFSVEALFDTLMQQRRYIEALEVAIAQLPEVIQTILPLAAQAMWSRGTYELLLQTLSRLPKPVSEGAVVLRWRLVAALELDREAEVLPEVEAYLAQAEAPHLRALYSRILYSNTNIEASLYQARRAIAAERNPLTLLAYGDALRFSDLGASLQYLKEALQLAEQIEDFYTVALAALAISRTLSAQCEYRGAADWAEWGLEGHERNRLGQNKLRLQLFNEWYFARVLLGDTEGLETLLRAELDKLTNSPLQTLLTTTLADLLMELGRPREAANLYRRLWEGVQKRSQYALIANLWVRALLEAGDNEHASQVAARAINRTSDLPSIVGNRASLAQGMAMTFQDPAKAVTILSSLLEATSATQLLRQTQTALYLAKAHLTLGNEAKAHAILQPFTAVLERLGRGGFRYLAGPEAEFAAVSKLLQGQPSAPLNLRFLGAAEVVFQGQTLTLRQRHSDILATLALHPEGLTGDTLTLKVYGKSGDPATAKADLSRLRKIIPIQARPYRLEVEVSADFLELPKLLSAGKVSEAAHLYQGQFLPKSDAPIIITERELLEEAIRQAALDSSDPDALLVLAERLKDDLELWEAALEALPHNDPRRVMAQLRAKKVDQAWDE